MKRLMVGLAAGALVAAMVPGVASASDEGCPPGANNIPKPATDDPDSDEFSGWVGGWLLQDVTEWSPDVDVGNNIDQNGDGLLCIRYAVGVSKHAGHKAHVARDNNLPEE
jgi:hypothetical protein